jgi:nitrite reductase (NO-forming)
MPSKTHWPLIQPLATRTRPASSGTRLFARAEFLRGSNGRDAKSVAMLIVATILACSALAARPSFAAEPVTRSFALTVEDKRVDIGAGMSYAASTYDGTVPGPVLRVRQGDKVTIHLINHTTSAHGIDIYAAQISPNNFSGDPGKEVTYTFRADVPGVFAYHCSAIPVLRHVADGMYGMMIVEPKDGWPNGKAREIDIVQGEFYGTPDKQGLVIGSSKKMIDAQPDFVVFNGMVNRYDAEHPIPIKVGQLVRVFFLDAGPNLPSVFHVSGAIFSTVYRSGNPADTLRDVPSFEVGPGNGAVFEFKVTEPGKFQFSDQSMAHPYKGAIGVFRATR